MGFPKLICCGFFVTEFLIFTASTLREKKLMVITYTALKISVFGVFLVPIFPHSD